MYIFALKFSLRSQSRQRFSESEACEKLVTNELRTGRKEELRRKSVQREKIPQLEDQYEAVLPPPLE